MALFRHRRGYNCDDGTLVVEVSSAYGLMPIDGQGSSSARVELYFDGKWFCTAVKEKNLNPVWKERFYFDYVFHPSSMKALEASVFNVPESKNNSKSFLGGVEIHEDSIPPFSHDIKFHYYKLEKLSFDSCVSGELCLKVYITDDPLVLETLQQLDKKDRSPRPRDIPLVQQEVQIPRPRDIPFAHLKEITDNFSDERILGHGGFGVVYKGVLQNGEMVAVKKSMSSLIPGLQKQFENEVCHLMMLNHPNIVQFVGYCYETRNECLEYNGKYVFAEMANRLLCFEYLPMGSLDRYISDESSGLDWSTRYNIIEGIFYGLSHLHEKLENPIIHLDLKPANILLNDDMIPKLTDFGLSRLLDQQQTICTSSRDGTFGYMAPEFLHGGTITPQSDIFSFGVVIIEVITGHRDYPDVTRTSSDGFIELTLGKWRNVLERSSGNGSLERNCEQIKRCIQVGLICVNPDRTKRPAIAKIINMLQGSESIDYEISNNTT